MNNDKWLNDIEKKLSGFEATPPQGVWNAVETSLKRRREAAGQARRQRTVRRRMVALWSAAATVAVFFLAGHYLLHTGQGDTVMPAANEHVALAGISPAESRDTQHKTPQAPVSRALSVKGTGRRELTACATAPLSVSKEGEPDGEKTAVCTEGGSAGNGSKTPTDGTKKETRTSQNTKAASTRSTGHGYSRTLAPRRRTSRITVSLTASNLLASTYRQQGYALLGSDAPYVGGEEMAGPEADAMDNVLESNVGQSVGSRTRHRLPVKVGLNVGYALTDRLMVETGITYSRLSSELTAGTGNSHYTTSQRLHYIGVPISVNYALLSTKRWRVYASGGGRVEKCVDGHSTTGYVVDGQKNTVQQNNIKEKELQLSVTAAAGLQYNVTRGAGLYVEPGVSYYFDNGSSVENIYKDKPMNFSLAMGVRISF